MKKILLVGYGLVGKVHADIIAANDNSDLIGIVVSPDHVVTKNGLEKTSNATMYLDLESAITTLKPDGVIIATPNQRHVEDFKICWRYRIPTLIEKPVFASIKDFETLENAQCNIQELNKYFMVGHHRLYGEVFEAVQSVVNSATLGDIRSIAGITHWFKPDEYFKQGHWRTSVDHMGGVLGINMIHEIATLIELFGPIREVFAFGKKFRGFDVYDTVSISYSFEKGMIGSWSISDNIVGNRSWEHNSGESDAFPFSENACLFIGGTKGSLEVPNMKLIRYKDNKEDWWKPTKVNKLKLNCKSDPLERQFETFLEFIDGNTEDYVNLGDGLRYLKTVESIQNSLVLNKPIEIDCCAYE